MADTQKGRGFIYVAADVWVHLGKPETPEAPEAWRKALLLPESYEVCWANRVNGGVAGDRFEICVLHEVIPVTDDSAARFEVLPSYTRRVEAQLERVVINQWNGQKWEQVAITDQREQ